MAVTGDTDSVRAASLADSDRASIGDEAAITALQNTLYWQQRPQHLVLYD